jgi:catechol 2,3-dioxygenase
MSTSPRDPEEVTAAGAPAHAEIAAATKMGAVHLTVSDLERSLAYYESVVGLSVRERGDGRVLLGAGGEDLLVLIGQPGARPSRGYCGLYHFALLLPERADLARWLAHAARDRVALVGLSDHFVSEAIYLSDPDGHGIEIYWDRPRELWEGRVAERMTTLPLDTSSLFAELVAPASGSLDPGREPVDPMKASFDGLPTGTTMGHVHLCLADIPRTIAFYRDVLGFALMASLGGQAAFLSAGGYHHHIGANTWESAGAGQPPEGSASLKQATIVLPSTLERDLVVARVTAAGYELRHIEDGVLLHDPSGNPILLVGP